jgi:hypothetical protein
MRRKPVIGVGPVIGAHARNRLIERSGNFQNEKIARASIAQIFDEGGNTKEQDDENQDPEQAHAPHAAAHRLK